MHQEWAYAPSDDRHSREFGCGMHVVVAETSGTIVGAGKLTSEPARLAGIEGMNTATAALRDDFAAGRRFAERFGFTLANHDIGLRLPLDGPAETLAARARETAEQAYVRVQVVELLSHEHTIMAAVAQGVAGLLIPFGADHTNWA
jgi:hypothetical protein